MIVQAYLAAACFLYTVASPIVWRGLRPPRVLIIIDPENVHKGTEKKIFEVEKRTFEKTKVIPHV